MWTMEIIQFMSTKINLNYIFICFAAEDRYTIAEPLVYNLRNYGIDLWYDRYELVMGDKRIKKNLDEGAGNCSYAAVIISENTTQSSCAMEELSILEKRYRKNEVTIFPVLYEISPENIPTALVWIKELIFKEVNRSSGTREVCNHIVCKITEDQLKNARFQKIDDLLNLSEINLPPAAKDILESYSGIDQANLTCRITLLYSLFLVFRADRTVLIKSTEMVSKIFERLYLETSLKLDIDYRELRLLENSVCIMVNRYFSSLTEVNI